MPVARPARRTARSSRSAAACCSKFTITDSAAAFSALGNESSLRGVCVTKRSNGNGAMSTVAAATVATLLIASPSMTDADHIAADGGFLLGNAQRCGVADERIVQAGRLVRGLISAAAEDGKAEQA